MKKIFILSAFVLLVQFAFAQQGLTDEQIIDYVMMEQQRGSDQKTIAAKLIQKGVTVDRLRRIREKYNAQGTLPGAVDLLGTEMKTNRSRTKEAQAKDNKIRRQGNLVRSTREVNAVGAMSSADRQMMLEEEMEFLDIDSVLYYKNLFKDEIPVFGRDIFNNEMLTFEPAMNVPIPANYVLGGGDQVIIDIWGASQAIVDEEISPDGYVVVEGYGPVRLAGKTIAEANEYVKGILSEIYSGSQISLTVGTIRSIQAQVMGEVTTPGTYTLSALSTAFNAVYAAGGISKFGTMRAIKVYRDGKLISTIDLYDYIFKGDTKGNVRLQDDDVIIVGAYDAIVNIQGKVKRPMFYEMRKDENLSTLVEYSGGFSGDAYKNNLRVIRKSGREYSIHTVGKEELSSFALHDGDSVFVDSVIPRFSNMVEINGAVFYPGQYEYGKKIKTVRELIDAAGGVREDAFLNRAVLHHHNYDNTISAQSINIAGILDGTVADVELRSNDVVFVPSESEMRGDETIKIGGEVRFPGTYKYAENTTVEDLVLQAGGLTRAASLVKVDVFRQLYDPKAVKESDQTSETFSFELKDGFMVGGDNNFTLKPFDEVYIRKSPIYTETQNVSIKGAVNFAGEYAMVSKNYRLSDLVESAGGLSITAHPKGAYLYRKLTEDELEQREILQVNSQIQLYEERLKSGNANIAVLDSLNKLKLNLGEYYPVAINLEEALNNPDGSDNLILRDGDIVSVPEYSSTVKISGEVRHPISITWEKGKKLSYYIKHAGGYSDAAKKSGVYAVYMNGSVEKISKTSSKSIEPGCEIIVPRKNDRRWTPAEIMSVSTSSISIVSMLVTLINVLK
ncbi:MAG: SLBB domain-containing protein [Bacteroidaceae bacterium]|nr:SLBB domain-containing protein [Bacteroidaceae bacterium]